MKNLKTFDWRIKDEEKALREKFPANIDGSDEFNKANKGTEKICKR